MHADERVMADYGGPIDQSTSDAKFDRYAEAWRRDGIGRWAVEDEGGNFLGYAGIMAQSNVGHPLGPHHEIGWRLRYEAWGQGFAFRAAKLALSRAWTAGGSEILSYTSPDNHRSQAVMRRLALRRDEKRDFVVQGGRHESWTGLVWVADAPVGQ